MTRRRFCAAPPWKPLRLLLVVSLVSGAAATAQGATYKVIHRFDVNTFGAIKGDFVADGQGRLYGTGEGSLLSSGNPGYVFWLTAPAEGKQTWSADIYTVQSPSLSAGSVTDGGVTLVNGFIYGANAYGGTFNDGTIFRIDPLGSLSVIYDFLGAQVRPYDGITPVAGMIQGPGKLLYGTTLQGGSRLLEDGIVYSVSPSQTKPGYRVLHRFGAAGDGRQPGSGRLAFDPQGRLFGVTLGGGAGAGTVFMMQQIAGRWQEKVIHAFAVPDTVVAPQSGVVLDQAGNLYSCGQGGDFMKGGVFKLAPPLQDGAAWTYSVLYSFGQAASEPYAALYGCALTLDITTGKLFGTSYQGGTHGFGTIWELDPPAAEGEPWTGSTIHSFDGSAADGYHPVAPPYKLGDSYYGGNLGAVVYQFTP